MFCSAEVHTDIRLPSSMLSCRESHSSSGDRRVPQTIKLSMVWIWQRGKRTDDNKDKFELCQKIDEK
jgi:hypothetical protein